MDYGVRSSDSGQPPTPPLGLISRMLTRYTISDHGSERPTPPPPPPHYDNPLKNIPYERGTRQNHFKLRVTWRMLVIPVLSLAALSCGLAMFCRELRLSALLSAKDTLRVTCSDVNANMLAEARADQLLLHTVAAYAPQNEPDLNASLARFRLVQARTSYLVGDGRSIALAPFGHVATSITTSSAASLAALFNGSFSLFNMPQQRLSESIMNHTHMTTVFPTQPSAGLDEPFILTIMPLYTTWITQVMAGAAMYSDYAACVMTDGICTRACRTPHHHDNITTLDASTQCHYTLWGFALSVFLLTSEVIDQLLRRPMEGRGNDIHFELQSRTLHSLTSANTVIAAGGRGFKYSNGVLLATDTLHKECDISTAMPGAILRLEVTPYIAVHSVAVICVLATLTLLVPALILCITHSNARFQSFLAEFIPRKHIPSVMRGQHLICEQFESATILFADIVGYTQLCSTLEPVTVIGMLDALYRRFDDLTEVHACYKTDTIGDAFMCMAGCPDREHEVSAARRVANLAFDMLRVVEWLAQRMGVELRVRIGIHTGTVHGCIMGHRVPHFTPIGNTVNVASRMESHGLPGCVHISQDTAKLLSGLSEFAIVPRVPMVFVKGKGPMSTYWLERSDLFQSIEVLAEQPEDSLPSTQLPSSQQMIQHVSGEGNNTLTPCVQTLH